MSTLILVIDDDVNFKRLLAIRLRAIVKELELKDFGSLDEARRFLGERRDIEVDLVVLDEHLPDGRGVQLLQEGWFQEMTVLSVSSDQAPEIAGSVVQAGASFFLSKSDISQPLFPPLVLGLVDRNRLNRELRKARIRAAIVDTVETLVRTIKHEINNPLGVVLGAAYLITKGPDASPDQRHAAELVESSANRINHVLDQLCNAVLADPVSKGNQKVFHIPGDKKWEE